MKKHDENKDLRSFARIGKIDYSDHTLTAPKNAIIGIHLWGKIDYLTHYCGWHFMWSAPSIYIYRVEETINVKMKKDKSTIKKMKND